MKKIVYTMYEELIMKFVKRKTFKCDHTEKCTINCMHREPHAIKSCCKHDECTHFPKAKCIPDYKVPNHISKNRRDCPPDQSGDIHFTMKSQILDTSYLWEV